MCNVYTQPWAQNSLVGNRAGILARAQMLQLVTIRLTLAELLLPFFISSLTLDMAVSVNILGISGLYVGGRGGRGSMEFGSP